ncbi:HEAT repeat-containing protein 3 isoform X2 [Denticeps clupeoides]|uniref:SYO1-like TPR repeats domain-containing protein n=1 Tax=Denticeps clupeoides TaxID=299321 RepID=A0AAY4BSX3_9TELE|nr:HEAT repeat-containing protein 3 isoform X2 [Denticeps clupeoides]
MAEAAAEGRRVVRQLGTIMGKTKSSKFKRPRVSADGLAAGAVKRPSGDDEEAVETDEDSPAAELLEKLQSPCADVRELACAGISRVVQQSQTIPAFLQRDAVRRLGPLLLDPSRAVRETAAGALRNLSACGGPEVCEDMVRQDILTPLVTLLRECCSAFEVSSAPSSQEPKHTVEGVANEAVNLLWNLCESSTRAVSTFNRSGLLDVLILCLDRRMQNVELALSAAHCLHTVTEDNAELLGSVNTAVLSALESVLLSTHTGMAQTLLRTLAAGVVWNVKASLPAAQHAQTLGALVATLSRSLELDAGRLVPELLQAEAARFATGGGSAAATEGMEEHMPADRGVGAGTEEELEEGDGEVHLNGLGRSRKTSGKEDDFSDLLPRGREELREVTALLTAQQTSLEIIVNMCCSDDPSDDEWEETSSGDEAEPGADGLLEGNSSLLSPLCLSAEVHGALIHHHIPQKVLLKAEFPSAEALAACGKTPAWGGVVKKMYRVQYRALTCLHNILAAMDTESLGGPVGLQAVAQHLASLVFSSAEVLKDDEFLEAVTSALRSLLQIMASKNIPQCMSPQQLMSLCEAATRCDVLSVRVNALAILGITGSTLAKQPDSAETLQMIGNALLSVATKDTNLVVCGEALDALFDVFADGEEAEKAAAAIRLLPALKALQPVFKAKIRKEGKGKYSPEQLCVLDNIKINLRRFVGYLEKQARR